MVETGYGGHFGVSVPISTPEGDSFIDVPAEGFEPPGVHPSQATHAYVASPAMSERVGRLGPGVKLGIDVFPHKGDTGPELVVPLGNNRGARLVRM